MHVKTAIFDRKTVLTGSVNMTHNGMENNKEHLLRLAEPQAVDQFVADFEAEWENAQVVDQSLIDMMMETHAANQEKKARSRSTRSQSLTREPSVRRSLSAELEQQNE